VTVKFVHIHIPKTAGTSVTSCMRKMFGNNRVAHFGRRERTQLFRELTRKQLSKYTCIGGHVMYPQFVKKVGVGPLYFSIVRDPLDRYVSFYSDVSQRESHPLHPVASQLSPSDFLLEVISEEYMYSQYRYLSRDGSFESAIKLVRSGKITVQSLENHDKLLGYIAKVAGKASPVLPRKNKSKPVSLIDRSALEPIVRDHFQNDFEIYNFVNSVENDLPVI